MLKAIIILSLLVAVVAMPSAFAAEVPGWIKNNAGWWADGTIDDSSFVSGIEWLVSNGIIEVPATAVSGTAESSIPGWVKNTAGWWAGDQISDDDFVNAIQHLIKVGIMSVPQAEQATSPEVEELLQMRENVINSIWRGADGFPTQLPDSVKKTSVRGFSAVSGADKITVEMKHGVDSIIYLLHPRGESNNELVVYHDGHSRCGTTQQAIDGTTSQMNRGCTPVSFDNEQINFLLDRGYTVLRVHMPLHGENNNPVITVPDCQGSNGVCNDWRGNNDFSHGCDGSEWPGCVRITMIEGEESKFVIHNQFSVLESDDFSPISYYVEPIAVALNYVDENFDYSKYHMIGLSGGGWTTVIYSAIDPRISHSFSVAGSHPHWTMTQDYEQSLEKKYINGYDMCVSPAITPELCNQSQDSPSSSGRIDQQLPNHEKDLYVLGGFGEDRKLTQFFHMYDDCCYPAKDLNLSYEETIKNRLASLGSGGFEISVADSTEHSINSQALFEFILDIDEESEKDGDKILKDLKRLLPWW
mgnify:CR=1 FL=1